MSVKNAAERIAQLGSIRNKYGHEPLSLKKKLLQQISPGALKSARAVKEYYDHLQFIAAYPDNPEIYQMATAAMEEMTETIKRNENLKYYLQNSGINGSSVCAAFGFEITKWLKLRYPESVSFYSMDAADGQVSAILSVVLPKVESEILQDGNDDWKSWLLKNMPRNHDILDALIAAFDQTGIRPEVKDELWNALMIHISIDLIQPAVLPATLYQPFYHDELKRKASLKEHSNEKPGKIKLSTSDARRVIELSRMVLVKNIREIDPISFTQPDMVSYYQLSRGLTVAIFGMVHERRHPIDNYMGYVAFKNGSPVAYAGSWLLFDSGRIGLNVFPAYRGGESQYLFGQVMELHRQVYKLKRFSVDPYQIGKDNSDGIRSGAFWTYYSLGFRPAKPEQRALASVEEKKRHTIKGYKSDIRTLKKLADSRMELILKDHPFLWDATDLSISYAKAITNSYRGNRKSAVESAFTVLVKLLKLEKAYRDNNLAFVLENWSVMLIAHEDRLRSDKALQITLRKMFEQKASGSEEEYLQLMNQSMTLRKLIREFVLS